MVQLHTSRMRFSKASEYDLPLLSFLTWLEASSKSFSKASFLARRTSIRELFKAVD